MDETVDHGYATREDIKHLEGRLEARIDKLDNRLRWVLGVIVAAAIALLVKGP